MKSFLTLAATLALVAGAHAGPVTFGPLVLTDNAAGLFAGAATTSAVGNVYTIDMPNFAQSNFDPNPGHIDFALTASSAMFDIIGVRLTYFGLFSGLGSAGFGQTVGNLPATTGSFSTPSFSTGLVSLAAIDSVDVSGFIDLADNGDSAQVTRIAIEVVQAPQNTVPEPQSYALAGLALAVLGCTRRRRR